MAQANSAMPVSSMRNHIIKPGCDQTQSSMETPPPWPTVSIVIPARNASARLHDVLRACLDQDYQGEYEIIVVDNGSVDGTKATARSYSKVKVVDATGRRASPYSARNRGIEASRGDIMALLDATCVPHPDWLARGIARMCESSAGLVAGEVMFKHAGMQPTAGELWDSVTNVQQRASVDRNIAKTANLFIHKGVIHEQGPFREGVRSGEDVRWTRDATTAGWQLVYAKDAIVEKPARGGQELLKKAARTGAGKARTMALPLRLAKGLGLLFVPPSISRVKRMVKERSNWQIRMALFLRVWCMAWCTRTAHGLGLLVPTLFERAD